MVIEIEMVIEMLIEIVIVIENLKSGIEKQSIFKCRDENHCNHKHNCYNLHCFGMERL